MGLFTFVNNCVFFKKMADMMILHKNYTPHIFRERTDLLIHLSIPEYPCG